LPVSDFSRKRKKAAGHGRLFIWSSRDWDVRNVPLLMTLGRSLTLLGLLDKAKAERGLSRILMVFGRVPLFYYVLHLYLIHILAILVALAFHQPVLHGSVIADFATKPAGYGHGLPLSTQCGFWRWPFSTCLVSGL
jgi:uncharacterized membrane protein